MKKIYLLLKILGILYVLLLIPSPQDKTPIQTASKTPFTWNQDSLWKNLENRFITARALSSIKRDSMVGKLCDEADLLLTTYMDTVYSADSKIYDSIEHAFFRIAPVIAAQEKKSDWHLRYYNSVRQKLKKDSRLWDMSATSARHTSYRILYGMRAAVEEILLQSDKDEFTSTMSVTDAPSRTPSIDVLGIKVHSGDLLVSRGGAEVSAFISRGNDYPGNFSHVALVYIDEESNTPYFVEAHIEKGVAIASLDSYLKDKKLRFMVMRPRSDLPEIQLNPMLPHEVSEFMYEEAQKRYIPYDFKMDYRDASAMFCSEVGSFAYKRYGISLWEFESTISSNGIINWLSAFGVANFVTQMPSDLEYDPMLSIVAEWIDKDVLFQDHLDNAVMDALISLANSGEELSYSIWALPLARVVKLYSSVLNLFGKEGVIPKGMNAQTALKNNYFVALFQDLKSRTLKKAERFEMENGYLPPYWQLVQFAEASLAE
ncbi:YiiX/YebB-like N1pC/P60 family cysteine hydrolase [Aestuariivivens sediminicola]|uniref:YiiX/YebB-like N1pC/P60 family cysteine hydrolase n=1 Tax=Aestuariivivens sediminicola TaxID=2913560 RepID=UPI001F5782DE|nr:YiiX/YebB-like N1pC/P60 family cysteine hydrolase [Aestuariivivens sediminicola]